MNLKPFLASTLAAGIVGNVIDTVVQGSVFTGMYYAKLPQLFRQDMNVPMLIFGDFVAAAVLVWFYQMVRSSFGVGWMNGARYGVCTGILTAFPLWIFMHMMFVGFPYALAWWLTIYSILWTAALGAITGLIHEKMN